MDLTKGGGPKVIQEVILKRFSDGSFDAKFFGILRRSEVLSLLKQCDRKVRTLLQRGANLGENDSKTESASPQERKPA